jgi:thiamine biosynthesis lipoprotein
MWDTWLPLDETQQMAVPEGVVLRFQRRAMATTFEVALPPGATSTPWEAATAALDEIDAVEQMLTVYRDDSQVSQLNALAAYNAVAVDEELFTLLSRCLQWGRSCQGAFDIACGALIKTWGFYRRAGRVPLAEERIAAMQCSGQQHVVLDLQQRSVRFRRRGLELNFGAVGKGYALDRAGQCLQQRWGVQQALLHGGGSSLLALGTWPGQPRGWPIRLRHPHDPQQHLGTIYLANAALGVSAATFQYFHYRGQRLGHVLDPRRGWPARGTACAAVIAPTAAQADALSTAAFVLGLTGAERLASLYPDTTVVVLPETPEGQTPDSPIIFQGTQRSGDEFVGSMAS